jgi:protein arginine kinase activator
MFCKTNEAKVHYTKINGDKMQKFDLCDACAKEKGVSDSANFPIAADILFGLGGAPELAPGKPSGEEITCPSCGFSQADFKKTGRLGCSACYSTFAAGLEGLLKTMHKGTIHAGKIPSSLRESRDLAQRAGLLQKNLELAIAEENFESAARLRDELKDLRKKMDSLTA